MKRYLIFALLLLCSTVNADTWSPSPIKPPLQTSDGGEGWQKGFDVKFAPSNGNIVYRVNDTSGVWKSTDGGASWEPSNQGFRFIGGASIGVHPTDPNIVLVGGSSMESASDIRSARESGIARTIDGGANWTVATSTTNGTDTGYLRCMFTREVLATCDLFAWVGGGTSTVYCGTARQGILRSTDLGATWKVVVPYSVTGQIYDMDLRGTGTNANKIIVASANGLTQYTDDGSAPNGYTTASTSGITGAKIIEVDQNDTDIMYAATYTQLYKSTTGLSGFSTSGIDNAEWSGLTSGHYIDSMRLCDADANKIYVHLWKLNYYPGRFYYSSDAGVNFNTPANGSWDSDGTVALFSTGVAAAEGSHGRTFIATHPTDSTIVLVQNSLEQVLKSDNFGGSFTYSNSGYMGYAPHANIAKTSEAIIVGSSTSIRTGNDFEIWKSLDNQATWTKIPKPSGQSEDSDAIAIEPNTDTPVLILANVKTGTTNAYIYRSDAGSFGSSWTEKTPNFVHAGGGCRYIKFNENDTNYIYAGQYRSSDKGVTWTKPFSNGVLDVYEGNNDIVYSITDSGATCWIRKCANARAATPTFSDTSPTFTMAKSSSAWEVGQSFCSSPTDPNKWYVPAGTLGVYVVHNGSTTADIRNKDHGLTTNAAVGNRDWDYVQCVADPNNDNVVYALAECHPDFRGGGIFKSTDGGDTWVSISSGTKVAYSNPMNMNVDPNTGYLHVHGFNGTFIYNADAPLIDIEVPTILGYYGTSSSTVTISGDASDTTGIAYVEYTLTGDTTGIGTATGTASWSINALPVNIGTTTVTVVATDIGSNTANDVIVIGRAGTPPENEVPDMIAPYTSEVITIDGTTTESVWGTATAHDIDLVISGVQVGTVTASARALWNENYVYVSIDVVDGAKNNDTGTTTPHLDTSVEVYLDMLRNKGAYGADDFHFILPWNQNNFIWEVGGNTSTVSSSISSNDSGYTLELALPWSLLTIAGTNSTTFGIDFQLDIDNDGGNTRECAKSAFNAFDTNYYNLDNLGLILLGTQTQSEGGGGGAGSSTPTKITGYIAEWKFDETSGSSTADSQGQNHGTHSGTGGRTISNGRYGKAVTVTGSSSFNCGSPAALDNIGTQTIVLVHKPTDDSGSILGKTTIPANLWEFSNTNAYYFIRDFAGTDLSILSTNDVISLNEWQTAAVTWDGGSATANVKHYVNGELVSQGTTQAGTGAYVTDAAKDLYLLNRYSGALPLAAAADNLAIFNRILTAQELLDCASWVEGTTSTALDVTSLTADLYGSCSITFGTTTIVGYFEYGTETGSYLAGSTTAQNTGRTTVGVSDVIHTASGLTAGTTYYYRLRVESPAYTVYGTESTFVTLSADVTVPTIEIIYPSSAANYQTSSSLPLLISGSSSDNVSVSQVIWINQATGATGTCVGTTQWNVQELTIQEGTNTCKFTVFDASNNQGTATINIYRNLDTPVTVITSPEPNCTLSDGTPAIGTTGVLFTLSGLASDAYNGVGTVAVSNSATTTVSVADGTDTWSNEVRVLPVLDDGLVFYAKLDETTGSQIKDYSVFKSHGTNTGSIAGTTSVFGGARYFDGIDDGINFGTKTVIGNTTNTFAFWMRCPQLQTIANSRIIEKLSFDGSVGIVIAHNSLDSNQLLVSYATSADNNQYSFIPNFFTDNWVHGAVVLDNNTARVYLNSIQVGTRSISIGNGVECGTATLFVGSSKNNEATKGYIDEARIYNRALSQAEITQLYTLTTPDQSNKFSATAYDTPLLNQGTDTVAIGAFPTTTTADATLVNTNSATFNGICSANSNTSTVWFEYGLTSGGYTGSSSTTVITDNAVSIAIPIGALNLDTEYFYRIRASNNVGETYGSEYSFTTDDRRMYTLEEVTGLSKPLSWSILGKTDFLAGLKAYGIYNPWTRWRSTADKKRLIDDTDEEITQAIEDL